MLLHHRFIEVAKQQGEKMANKAMEFIETIYGGIKCQEENEIQGY